MAKRQVSLDPSHSRVSLFGDILGGTIKPKALDIAGVSLDQVLRGIDEVSSVVGSEYALPDMIDGSSGRITANFRAIQVMNRLLESNQLATPDEVETLKGYTSFGAVPKIFETDHPDYDALRSILSHDHYAAARKATVNSFYTNRDIISVLWSWLRDSLGFTGGAVLDPAIGTGNFYQAMPHELRQASTLIGVDMDTLAGSIAKLILPDAQIALLPFQKAQLPQSFDLAITNVPFGQIPIYDKMIPREVSRSIHNYYIAKMASLTAVGGLVAVITSRHTMDSKTDAHRRYMADHLRLLAGVRLPTKTFRQYAGCDVVTDVLIFERIAEPQPDQSWVQAAQIELEGPRGIEQFSVNPHFLPGSPSVLGDYRAVTGPFSAQLDVRSDSERTIAELMQSYLTSVETDYLYRRTERKGEIVVDGAKSHEAYPGDARDGQFFVRRNGTIAQRVAGEWVDADKRGKIAERISGMIEIADLAYAVLKLNTAGSDFELREAQNALTYTYLTFIGNHGYINERSNTLAFKSDPRLPFLCALELRTKEKGVYARSSIFSERVIDIDKAPTHVDSAEDAFTVSITYKGGIDWDFMADVSGLSISELQSALNGRAVFYNPVTNVYEPANLYLSGNVRNKLAEAKAAGLDLNVDALTKVVPADVVHSEIFVKLGASWIPTEIYERFIFEIMDADSPINDPGTTSFDYARERRRTRSVATVRWVSALGRWEINGTNHRYSTLAKVTWGTGDRPFSKLIDHLMNGTQIVITRTDRNDRKYVDQSASIAAREKANEINKCFQRWIFSDEERTNSLVRIYNDMFNSIVAPKFAGEYINFPGQNNAIMLRVNQRQAIERVLTGRNTLLWHIVGSGKTFSAISASMKMRQLGLRKKPIHVVLNNLLGQYVDEFYRLYPDAKLLVITSDNMSPSEIKTSMSMIATNDWDSVIITQSSFERIPLSPELHQEFYERKVEEIDAIIEDLKWSRDEDDERTVKRLEAKRLRLEERLDRTMGKLREYGQGLYWSDLGIDLLIADECHLYKSLGFATNRAHLPGVGGEESGRAYDMFMKTQWMTRRCVNGHILPVESNECRHGCDRQHGSSVVFMSGTPVTNSISELYTYMRYLQYDLLVETGLVHFDHWASQFGSEVTSIEMKPSGKGWRMHTRFAAFHNVPELWNMIGVAVDTAMDPDEIGLQRPRIVGGAPIGVKVSPSEPLLQYIDYCARRAENLKNVKPDEDNMLSIMHDSTTATTDMRLISHRYGFQPGCKIDVTMGLMDKHYHDCPGTCQVAFLDTSTPKAKLWEKWDEYTAELRAQGIDEEDLPQAYFNLLEDRKEMVWSLYDDIKLRLIQRGWHPDEIAFIHDADTPAKIRTLFDRVNRAEVRLLIASTEKAGAGANFQQRLKVLYHIDVPWTPALVSQREGRILRPGNTCDEVYIYRIIMEKSLDFYRWDANRRKSAAIAQLATGVATSRTVEDMNAVTLSYAEMQALATGDEILIERVGLEAEVERLFALRREHERQYREATWAYNNAKRNLSIAEQAVTTCREVAAILDTLDIDPENDPIFYDGRTEAERKDLYKQLAKWVGGFIAGFKYRIESGKLAVDLELIESDKRTSLEGTFIVDGISVFVGSVPKNPKEMVARLFEFVERFAGYKHDKEYRYAEALEKAGNHTAVKEEEFPYEAEYQTAVARLNEIEAELASRASASEVNDDVDE